MARVDKVIKIISESTSENILPLEFLYLWRTPVGSFGYGDLSIRIKLKPNVKFKLIGRFERKCPISPEQDANTVYVWDGQGMNHLEGYSEYILCSSGPVESWSYGMPQALEEIKRELTWIFTHSENDYDRLVKDGKWISCKGDMCLNQLVSHQNQIVFPTPFATDNLNIPERFRVPGYEAGRENGDLNNPIIGINIPDAQTNWGVLQLNYNLLRLQKIIDEGSGKIFYSEDSAPNAEKHFQTKFPSYFNSESGY